MSTWFDVFTSLLLTHPPPHHATTAIKKVYLLEGEAVSQSDLENAGVRTAKAVLVMKDPK